LFDGSGSCEVVLHLSLNDVAVGAFKIPQHVARCEFLSGTYEFFECLVYVFVPKPSQMLPLVGISLADSVLGKN
jgi:hypothetical protein